MTDLIKLKSLVASDGYETELEKIYVTKHEVSRQRTRLEKLINNFSVLFGENREAELFSAPGRTEIGGNHTDHNNGKVLAASINLDAVAVVSKNNENIVRVKSEGYPMDTVNLDELDKITNDHLKSAALVRGVCAGFKLRGYKIGGFDAVTASDVLKGSGLSSSAAFEVLLGTILNHVYNEGKISPVIIAQIAQYSENEYFGKPCGLMDQTASSVGGFVTIDFKNPQEPVIEKVDFNFSACGYALCIIDTGGSHSGLNEEYAAIRSEMESVAHTFNKKTLSEVSQSEFESAIPELRKSVGDRAVLRSIHFYADNMRVEKQAYMLRTRNFEGFKSAVIESGRSSYMYNQNVYLNNNPRIQPVSMALCLSEKLLLDKGAWRVHGGGFAGTIQAFVPLAELENYKACIESVFGLNSCHVLSVRPVGGVKICG